MIQPDTFSIRNTFAGKGVLLTGSTGFLAKAVTEKILRDLPEVGQIFLLIRPRVKADGSRIDPRQRLREEVLRNSAFRRLREQLGEGFESFCDSKITCVPGDLTHARLGLEPEVFAELANKVQIVINSAATVVFDERLDMALALNTMGPQGLLEFAKAARGIYVHISTAYVSGRRTGMIPENLMSPMEAIDRQLPSGVPRPIKFDLLEEVERLAKLADTVKKDCDWTFKQKGIAADSEEASILLRSALVNAGMRRAQSLGWNDTYTYTKFLGEQLIKMKHGSVPTVIVRPSIIESSLAEPEPGWLDGLRMADPIIIGFGKGRLSDFPANQNVVLDIIPADLVVNAILAAAAYISNATVQSSRSGPVPVARGIGDGDSRPDSGAPPDERLSQRPPHPAFAPAHVGPLPEGRGESTADPVIDPGAYRGRPARRTPDDSEPAPAAFDIFTVASSSENPLVFINLYDHVRDYFRKHPMTDRAGKPVAVPAWKFPSIEKYRRTVRNRYLRPLRAANAVLNGPISFPGTRRMRARLRTLNTTLEQLLYYVDIYGPYVTLECRFETTRTRELFLALSAEERERFNFDPRRIRWRNYLQDVHIPGLKRNILRMVEAPRTGAGEGHLLDEETEAIQRRRGASATLRGVPQTVVDLCGRGHERFGNKSLVQIRRTLAPNPSCESGTISYTEMFERSGVLARQLIARLDLHPGDRVALMAENCPEWALAYLAISRACCTVVPLDRSMPLQEAVRLSKLVDARALVISPTILKTSPDEFRAGDGLPPLLDLYSGLAPHPGGRWPYPEASLGDRPLKEPAPETLASILFTSGTTRDPKGVMLSHANVIADALSVAEVLEPLESDRFLSLLPLHHAFEFTCGFLIPMYGGATIHHIEFLRPKDIQETMQLAKITVVLGVPRVFKLFMDGINSKIKAKSAQARLGIRVGQSLANAWELAGNTDLRKRLFKEVHEGFGGKLRLFVSGGDYLDQDIFNFFKGFGITIVEGYGLTETSPVLTVNPLAAPKAGSAGPPVPGVELRIHTPGSEGVGEVLARGPTITQGYWQNPAATEKAFEDGWFKTGDLGRIDRDGYLHITGRLKDVIVTAGGKNVYPDEIEAILAQVSGMKELCVLGLPSRFGMGEEVAAIIVPQNESIRQTIQDGIERINRELPSHQRIARIEFQADELPKTSTLKVQRNKLREHYGKNVEDKGPGFAPARIPAEANNQGSDISVLSLIPDLDPVSATVEVLKVVSEVAGRVTPSEISLDTKLQMDLGIDSIGRVDLIQKLELQLDISIPHEMEGRLFTVRDVVAAVEAAPKLGAKRKDRSPAPQIWARSKGKLDDIRAGMRQSVSKSVLQGVFSTTASVFMNNYLRIECHGIDNIPASGPYILAANHCSHLDSIAIREVLGKRASGLHVMGAKDYFFDTRLKSWFFTTFLNALPFDREDNISESLAACKEVLESGRAILLFPEGTRSMTGELQPFRPGIGVLGIELEVPLIPLYLRGTYESLPKGKSIPRPTRIEVHIGPAILLDDLKKEKGGISATDLYRRAAAQLRARIEALRGKSVES